MLNKRFHVESIKADDLNNFLDIYKPCFDFPNIEEIFNRTLELAYNQEDVSFTNVIHACYDNEKEKYCAILNIGTTTAIDDTVSIDVEFLFIEKEYRKNLFKELDSKLSEFLLLDYVIGELGLKIKNNIGISIIALTPINEKVRKTYEEIGFESISESGSNKFEDWMIFNF